jgi:hypothetical protein
VLILDADGFIHRDFYFFWPRLRRGGLIVIDDYQEGLDPKHDLTFHLLNALIRWGLFETVDKVGSTMFGRKPAHGDIRKLDLQECHEIVADNSRKYGVVFGRTGVSKL